MIALLHDIGDVKLHASKEKAERFIIEICKHLAFRPEEEKVIIASIASVSFNGGHEKALPCFEAAIVRDADRLDAIGAVGIARAFTYGGAIGLKMYEESDAVRERLTEEDYRKNQSSTITHFYEKLLKISGLMITITGKKLAKERHEYMEDFLEKFLKEWKGHT